MTIHVRVFYPADPLGVVPGGIDTFLRGLFKYAPPDLEFSLVGMTTDPVARPLGTWTRCHIGQRDFDFFPVVAVSNAGGRGRIPLSLRFSIGVWRHQATLSGGFDVFDFHRPEPSLLFTLDSRPKNAYFHNDPDTIRLKQSDNLWRRLPNVYERLERLAFDSFDSAWCVRESGVQALRLRYPTHARQINFMATWVDSDVFNCIDDQHRQVLRHAVAKTYRLDEAAQWIVTVGRLDLQKDPFLMLAAFSHLIAESFRANWLIVGDGVLRPELENRIRKAGLDAHVRFIGLLPAAEIADLLRVADGFALSSAYEGMPMALLEALGCGLPAAVTDVGEVRRVVKSGINGEIATARTEDEFTRALTSLLTNAELWRGIPARSAVEDYQPEKVLVAAYENYRKLGRDCARLRASEQVMHDMNTPGRCRSPVIGTPIDIIDQDAASTRILAWAKNHESRTACFANVHSTVLARFDHRHRLALLGADLVAADGAPIAWSLQFKGYQAQQRLDGPSMMWRLCADAEAENVKIGLYGATQETLLALQAKLRQAFPLLDIAYSYSPPFRDLSDEEDAAICADVTSAGVGLLFVGLGCPKQEYWMARHQGRIRAVMLGVGAAFDFHAGIAARAPLWMRKNGLEWLHRLLTHPRRLWRRYLFSNSIFLAVSAREALRHLVNRIHFSRP